MPNEVLDNALLEQVIKVNDWLFTHSFPFWMKSSVNPDGGFYERHTLSGEGIRGEDSRVRLQARQTYCFALAAELGWKPNFCELVVRQGMQVLTSDCRRPDGLYGTRVMPGTGLTNPGAETYDCAFALLAFSTALRVMNLEEARIAGSELRGAMHKHLRDVTRGGIKNVCRLQG